MSIFSRLKKSWFAIMAAPPQPLGRAVEIYFRPSTSRSFSICDLCDFFPDFSHTSLKNPTDIRLSNMSVRMFPSFGKMLLTLYVATVGKNCAAIILSGTCWCMLWSELSLSMEETEILPSSWRILDVLQGFIFIFGDGGGGSMMVFLGGSGPPLSSFPH